MGLLSSRARATTAGSAALLVVLAITSTWLASEDGPALPSALISPHARVTEGPFEVYVTASALIDARQSVTLSSELPSNQAKILYLADEGVVLKAGEDLARFDPAPFEDEQVKLEAELKELRATLEQAEAEKALIKQEMAERKSEIDYQVTLAQLDRNNLESVDIPNREQVARKQADKAKAEYRRASREARTQEKLYEQGLSRKSDLETAQDAELEKKAAFDIAARELKALIEITFPSEREQARLNVEKREREQSGFGEVTRQRTLKQQATIARLGNRIAGAEQKLAKARRNLEMTVLRAPVTGIVLYKRLSFGPERRKPQVGDSLWNRNPFAEMPDLSSLVAYARVDEKDVGKLEPGQRARISPEAYRDLLLSGTVDAVGTLADEDTESGATRYFSVRIALDKTDARLRPGMSARASILASAYSDVTKIPLEGVFYENDLPVGFVFSDGAHRRVELELGDTDGQHIVVESGLAVGEQVSLLYPEDAQAANP